MLLDAEKRPLNAKLLRSRSRVHPKCIEHQSTPSILADVCHMGGAWSVEGEGGGFGRWSGVDETQ